MTAAFRLGENTIGPLDQRAHPQHLAHSARLQKRFYPVGEQAFCFVGNGLSNQTFVLAPEGVIAIDTGECHEEMAAAIAELRNHTDAPIVACIYSHFHYVAGTSAIVADRGDDQFPIFGHAGITANLERFGGEVGPRGSRGMVHQFAMQLPESGPDGLVNIGLGLHYRNPSHAPYTPGHLPVTHAFDAQFKTDIAGLPVEFYLAPSDATDSVTIYFPSLDLAVNNIFWPVLFNVFAIRGEEYRDPRVLLNGLDDLANLEVEHQICAHGPPMSGRAAIHQAIERYRDSIQFIWDQTVRHANQGYSLDEMIHKITLPAVYEEDFHTQQLYGVVEHHIRQVYTGLFGWFDEDAAKLFPEEPSSRSLKLIDAMGGLESVRTLVDKAIGAGDLRWGLELAEALVRYPSSESTSEDQARLADLLRKLAHCSPSANVRNWCLTRALELGGQIDLSRFRIHRFREAEVLSTSGARWVAILRVLLNAELAGETRGSIGFVFDDGTDAGLIIRHGVAVPVSSDRCQIVLNVSKPDWAKLLAGKLDLSAVLAQQRDFPERHRDEARQLLKLFDLASFQR
jgi:alkyl sulfatase BDS1-like metallo-beta-lactamase superfamily hydrolase